MNPLLLLFIAAAPVDISSVPPDLTPPPMIEASTAPGKRVKMVARGYETTEVFHSVYLPTDWKPGKKHPVIVEYAGNGPYQNKYGDVSSGRVEDVKLGYGISGGTNFIWIVLPYISADGQSNQRQWWGSVEKTVAYAKAVVPAVCTIYGGDTNRVVLTGFSRGAIACNYIGLHDDEIAGLWRAFICHSHYDGVRKWGYPGSDKASAKKRLARLGNKPQFISQEHSVAQTETYLKAAWPEGHFTFLALPYRNHTDAWLLRDIPERKHLRTWLHEQLK